MSSKTHSPERGDKSTPRTAILALLALVSSCAGSSPGIRSEGVPERASAPTAFRPSAAAPAATGIPVDPAEVASLAARLPSAFVSHVPRETQDSKAQLTPNLAGSVGITVIQRACGGDPLFVSWGVAPSPDRVKLVPNDPWLDVVWELSETDRREIARMFLSDPQGKAASCRPENLTH